MSKQDAYIRNPLVRDGSSQLRRFVKALDPTTVAIDGRTRQEFIDFARNYAEIIRYYDNDNQTDGTWSEFFRPYTEAADPHYALFLAFIRIMGIAQEELNGITARHLDYFYKQVLGMEPRAARPDQVHVLLELAKNQTYYKLPAGTLLSAGKDSTKVPIYYRSDRELIVNRMGVASLKSVYFDRTEENTLLYASPIADSADGLGKDLTEEEPNWSAFGESQQDLTEPSMPQGEIGFAISSPLLLLQEGNRHIRLRFIVETDDNLIQAAPLRVSADADFESAPLGTEEEGDFNVYLSGAKAWVGPFPVNASVLSKNVFEIEIAIDESYEAITSYNQEKMTEGFATGDPIIRIMVNPESQGIPLDVLRNMEVQAVEIEVDVTGVRNLIVQNDESVLDPSKPFMPFGSVPGLGSSLYIGSQEVFSKKLTSLNLEAEWFKIPDNLAGHYSTYGAITNTDFKAKFSVRQRRDWTALTMKPEAEGITNPVTNALFHPAKAGNAMRYNILPKNPADNILERTVGGAKVTRYESGVQYGFLRMELDGIKNKGTDFLAFGHSYFPRLYTQQIIKKTVGENGTPDPNAALPNEPYTPYIKSLSLNYSSKEIILLSRDQALPKTFDRRVERFFHVGPFGQAEQHPYTYNQSDSFNIPLMPWFSARGTFFLGIDNFNPDHSRQLSLLFQVAEGTADPSVVGYVGIRWSYLVDNQWYPFGEKQIISDSTRTLIRSGIITFDLPKELSDDNTLLPKGTFWLRAEPYRINAGENDPAVGSLDLTTGLARFVAVYAQAVTATFTDQGNEQGLLAAPLAAGSITKMVIKDTAIKGVKQPFASFGGKMQEGDSQYYTRVSERLRHKNRSINIWDYEHMVLEEFPDIYKIKCLNHSSLTQSHSPGHVTLVVIPNLQNREEEQKLRPQASINTLQDIHEYVSAHINPFVKLEVTNPVFEEIRLDFGVSFREGYDDGFYLTQIQQDIIRHLTPWAYSGGKDIAFEGKLHASSLLDFVEELEYVDFLTCFKMYHTYQEGELVQEVETDTAEVKTAASILVSAIEHDIRLVEFGDCSCDEDDEVEVPTEGIGAMIIGVDFIISDPNQTNK